MRVYEVTLTVEVSDDADFLDTSYSEAFALGEYIKDVLYDVDDIDITDYEVKEC